ncbi:hypothetical protein EIN_327930 [Entamoeba invadens IP1]|uniref:ELM2 domain-containing protein n=1 Tax=Entamoeba invadens IP1 TaxID=370355 RepID=A0A0A1U3F2_ENTIV|nr:hypothetical protein EIN_327930 [Entamoeba invadens IP1]ELP86136.1 hypothetical protein EIN_327930 [Entamoeba invadens IP1]|eukprot:XP_004185482.1 hypothetical protein EIN_327930 [Entamoeba invadens IP1]
MMAKHQTRVGPEYQAVIPTEKYFAGPRPTFGRCVNKATVDGVSRADTAEAAGIMMFRCDAISKEALNTYMTTAERMTPPYVKFDRTEALQFLHNNDYIVEDALLQLKVNMDNQNRYNSNQFKREMHFNHFD